MGELADDVGRLALDTTPSDTKLDSPTLKALFSALSPAFVPEGAAEIPAQHDETAAGKAALRPQAPAFEPTGHSPAQGSPTERGRIAYSPSLASAVEAVAFTPGGAFHGGAGGAGELAMDMVLQGAGAWDVKFTSEHGAVGGDRAGGAEDRSSEDAADAHKGAAADVIKRCSASRPHMHVCSAARVQRSAEPLTACAARSLLGYHYGMGIEIESEPLFPDEAPQLPRAAAGADARGKQLWDFIGDLPTEALDGSGAAAGEGFGEWEAWERGAEWGVVAPGGHLWHSSGLFTPGPGGAGGVYTAGGLFVGGGPDATPPGAAADADRTWGLGAEGSVGDAGAGGDAAGAREGAAEGAAGRRGGPEQEALEAARFAEVQGPSSPPPPPEGRGSAHVSRAANNPRGSHDPRIPPPPLPY